MTIIKQQAIPDSLLFTPHFPCTMSFATPISKDGFYYNGDLYAEVGDLNRHKRASIPEIRSVLHPVLDQAQATTQASSKDPVGHWYTAQLVHYGLPVSKTKAVAKTRLLDALNSGMLTVPAHLARLEADLKKEWVSLERKAKAAYKAEFGAGRGGGAKRKGAEMKLGDSPAAPPAAKKARKMPPKVTEVMKRGPVRKTRPLAQQKPPRKLQTARKRVLSTKNMP